MPTLNQKDIEILASYAENKNRELYWNYLAHKEGNDGYGLLALGVVRSDNAPGATANIFADNRARQDGVRMSEPEWNQFGIDLMKSDLAIRQAQMKSLRPDLALNLPVRDVQAAHDRTFNDRHINPNAWTPRELLEAARRHGGEPEAEKTWTMMLDNQALGLSRMSSTSWDALHRYNDEQLDATSYVARMGAARSEATQSLPNTDPNRIGAVSFYANYDTGSHQWSQVTTAGGQISIQPVRDPAQIKALDDTRDLRLQRQALRDQFNPEDPYRHQPIMQSPYLLSENRSLSPDGNKTTDFALASTLTPDQPGHPRHSLYQQCSAGVDALDQQLGRQSDNSSACMMASLTTLAAANGFEQVDQVKLSKESDQTRAGENVFIVQGDPTNPAHLRAHLPTDQAVNTPVEASFRELAQIDQRQQQLQNTQALTQTQQPELPGHGPRTLG